MANVAPNLPVPHDQIPNHGTLSAYNYYRCRCLECVTANRQRREEQYWGRRTRLGTRTPKWTACARCGHGSNVHGQTKACRECDCPKWTAGRCSDCREWCFSGNQCMACYRAHAAERRRQEAAWRASPEYQALKERREQIRWLNEGRKTLQEVRRLARSPEAVRSAQGASTRARTSRAS